METTIITTVLTVAIIIEAVIQGVKMVIEDNFGWENITAFILGGLGSWVFGVDALSIANLEPAATMPAWVLTVINAVFMAFVLMRYSGSANDLLTFLTGLRPQSMEGLDQEAK